MRILFSGLLGMLSSWGCFEGECLIRRFDFNVSSWLEYLFVATECMLVLECSGHFSKYEGSNVLTTQRSPVDINRQSPRRSLKSLDPDFSHLRAASDLPAPMPSQTKTQHACKGEYFGSCSTVVFVMLGNRP